MIDLSIQKGKSISEVSCTTVKKNPPDGLVSSLSIIQFIISIEKAKVKVFRQFFYTSLPKIHH
jgi:hypothetical protein